MKFQDYHTKFFDSKFGHYFLCFKRDESFNCYHKTETSHVVQKSKALYQGCPKPVKQGTDKSERILANLDETERIGHNRAKAGKKTGIFKQKWAKTGETRQNRATNG